MDPENEFEPRAELCLQMAIQEGELSMVLMLTASLLALCGYRC